jgi:hypothetical protein
MGQETGSTFYTEVTAETEKEAHEKAIQEARNYEGDLTIIGESIGKYKCYCTHAIDSDGNEIETEFQRLVESDPNKLFQWD